MKNKNLVKRVISVFVVAGLVASTVQDYPVSYAAEKGVDLLEFKTNNSINELAETEYAKLGHCEISDDTYIVMSNNEDDYKYIEDICMESTENISGEYEYIPEDDYEIVHLQEETIQEIQEKCEDVIIEEDCIVKASRIKGHEKKKEKKHPQRKNTQKLKKKEYNDKKHEDWNKKIVNADDYDENIQTERKVKVAIIDSGINFDVRFDVKESINLVPGEEEVTPLFMDTSGHGMSVASVITGVNEDGTGIGINENVELYSARVLDDDGNAPISRVIEAIYWAIEKDVDIINMSFGTSEYSAALEKAVTDAENAGILIVAAAGNDETVEYPAAYEEVIAVGSVNSECEISDFSATGEDIELVAPGETIKVADAFNTETAVSGTSVAAPHVTAIASVLMQNDSEATNDLVREVLNKSANSLGDSDEYGNGVVDMEYALEIYEDVKENYESNEVLNVIETNESVIEVYDSGEVKRSWSVEEHKEMARRGGGDNKYTLYGAKAPDVMTEWFVTDSDKKFINKGDFCFIGEVKGYSKLSENPEFHGGGHGSDAYLPVNYVACYSAVIRMTNWLYDQEKNGKSVSKNALKNMVKREKYGQVLYNQWNLKQGKRSLDVLVDAVYEMWIGGISIELDEIVSINNRRKFLYGVAMHILADSFAHSAYRFLDGKWQTLHHRYNEIKDDKKISEDEKVKAWQRYADNVDIASNRWCLSYATVYNTWQRLNKSDKNNYIYRDYYQPITGYKELYNNRCDASSFRIRNLIDYAMECGLNYENPLDAECGNHIYLITEHAD